MKKYIKSYTADDLKAQLGDNYPKGGYLYILKHGIGPGTIPRDVTVIKTKDLPNYYTAVWLDRFLSADELREYDIPSETDINKYLGRINYCQKNGDVVPCDEVKGSTSVRGFTPAHIDDPDDEESEWYDWWNDVDGYLLEYDDNFKKIIYDFRDKYGMPKNMSDDLCDKLADVIFDYVKNNLERLGIDPNENTDQDYSEFAHERMVEWLVEPYLYGDFWDDYQGNSVEGCGDIKCATSVKASTNDSSIVNKIYSVMMDYEYGYDPDMTDINTMLQELTNKGVHVDTSDAFKQAWVSAHNKAERKTWGSSGDSYHYDSLTPEELEAIENYDTEYWEYVKDHPFNLKPASVTSSISVKAATKTPKFETLRDEDGVYGYKLGNWYLMKIYSWGNSYTWYIFDEPNISLFEHEKSKYGYVGDGNEQGYVHNLKEGKQILMDRYLTENGEGDVQACDQVTASISVDTSTLEPRQRTAVDGKTWWVVFDTATGKYSTYTCFGKYKTKKDCQYAIDHCDYSRDINSATEPNAPDAKKSKLVREIIKRAKEVRDYFQSHNNNLNRRQEQILDDLSDGIDNQSIGAIRDAVENLKYNSKNMRSGQYDLVIDLYNDFNLAGGKFEGMGYPESDDIEGCDNITSSTNSRYFANMVSASSSDSAYDENDELYKYYVAGYYSVDSNGHPYGLAESLYTNDFDEALETAHTYCGNGNYIEFTNQITGMSLDYDPDDWEEATSYGEYPTSVYDLY